MESSNKDVKTIVDELLDEMIENAVIAVEALNQVIEGSNQEGGAGSSNNIEENVEEMSDELSVYENLRLEDERRKQQMIHWNIQRDIQIARQVQPVVEQPVLIPSQPSTSAQRNPGSAWDSDSEEEILAIQLSIETNQEQFNTGFVWESENEETLPVQQSISPVRQLTNDQFNTASAWESDNEETLPVQQSIVTTQQSIVTTQQNINSVQQNIDSVQQSIDSVQQSTTPIQGQSNAEVDNHPSQSGVDNSSTNPAPIVMLRKPKPVDRNNALSSSKPSYETSKSSDAVFQARLPYEPARSKRVYMPDTRLPNSNGTSYNAELRLSNSGRAINSYSRDNGISNSANSPQNNAISNNVDRQINGYQTGSQHASQNVRASSDLHASSYSNRSNYDQQPNGYQNGNQDVRASSCQQLALPQNGTQSRSTSGFKSAHVIPDYQVRNQLCQGANISSTQALSIPETATDYEWIQTQIPSLNRAPADLLKRFEPRIKPRYFDISVDSHINQMQKTEYLIGYCNGYIAIGMIKHEKDIKDQPLMMQFGVWNDDIDNKIYVGCTVIVKSFAQMCDRIGKKVRNFATVNALPADLIQDGCIYANTLATSWFIVNKPKFYPSLGCVKDFQVDCRADGSLRFSSNVYDQENDMDIKVVDELLPLYMTKPLPFSSIVVLRWVIMEKPFTVLTSKFGLKIMLPIYGPKYFDRAVENSDEYWLTKVDNRYAI